MRRHRSSNALGIVILALVATACVSPNDPGVAIDARDADLVFGVKEPSDAPPTPQQASAPGFDNNFDFADFGFSDNDVPAFEVPTVPEKPAACPKAPSTASPKQITEPFVTGDPREGSYKWTGKRDITDGSQTRVEEMPIHRRIVRAFNKIDDTRFTYETVQPLLDGNGHFLVTEWTVEKDPETISPPNETGAVQGVVVPPRVGEPEGGLMITALRVVDAGGAAVPGVQPFTPTTGLMMLPLPVTSGQTFQSSAVDPRTGQTVLVEGLTHARARVDACGELMDGWRVAGTQTIQVAGEDTIIDFDMIVATQFGAWVIEEITRDRCCTIFVTTRAGQVTPDPLAPGQE